MSRRRHMWRYNPTSGDTPYIIGGALAFAAGLWFLSSRPSHAAIVTLPPAPTPRPQPTQPTIDMSFTPEEARAATGLPLVRQSSMPTESPRTLRIMQQQLQDLGYAITRIDGVDGEETRRESRRFAAVNGLPANISPIDLVRAIDAEYVRAFAQGYVP